MNCTQRLMDDKQLALPPAWLAWILPLLKTTVRPRSLSTAIFRSAAHPGVMSSVLKHTYPTGAKFDDALVDLLFQPSKRNGAAEAFRGFIICSTTIWPPIDGRTDDAGGSDLGGEGSLGPAGGRRTLAQHDQLRALTQDDAGSRATAPMTNHQAPAINFH